MVSFSPPPAARAKMETACRLRDLIRLALKDMTSEQENRLTRVIGQLKGTGVADLEQLVRDLINRRKP